MRHTQQELEGMSDYELMSYASDDLGLGETVYDKCCRAFSDGCIAEIERRGLQWEFCWKMGEILGCHGPEVTGTESDWRLIRRTDRQILIAAILAAQGGEG